MDRFPFSMDTELSVDDHSREDATIDSDDFAVEADLNPLELCLEPTDDENRTGEIRAIEDLSRAFLKFGRRAVDKFCNYLIRILKINQSFISTFCTSFENIGSIGDYYRDEIIKM